MICEVYRFIFCFLSTFSLFFLLSLTQESLVADYPAGAGGGRGGYSHIKVTRLLLGSKLQILVSLLVFGMDSHYLPIQVSLSTVHKEIYKTCPNTDHTEISLRGQFKLEPHPHWSPLGV